MQATAAEHARCARLWLEVGRGFWTARTRWTTARWSAYVGQAGVSFWIASHADQDVGFFELVARVRSVKIEGFGLLPAWRGRHLGGGLLTAATQRAFAAGARRVWLHTATDDHPNALPNYQARGYRVYRERALRNPMPPQASPRSRRARYTDGWGLGAEIMMIRPPSEVRSATSDESTQAIAAIVAAFITDPLARFAWPSPHDHLRASPRAAREFGGGSFEHGTAYVSADFCGTALWLPPGVHPNGEALERVFRETAKPEHLDDLLTTFEQMDQWHPEEPHWYLTMIGVEPNAQGKGLGAELMRHAVAHCDRDGTLAYLESSNRRNISLYMRHGFEPIGEIRAGAAPLVTPMLRRPRRRP